MEMLELAAELKGCREQIAAYEVERAQMQQYYRRAIADRDEAKATISRLRDEVNDALRLNAEYEVDIQELHEQVTRLREYARHKHRCAMPDTGSTAWVMGRACDCGYDELIKEIGG